MNADLFEKIANRGFFVLGFLLLALAIGERAANVTGYTILRGSYTPSRLLEIASVFMLVVAVLLLRQISHSLRARSR